MEAQALPAAPAAMGRVARSKMAADEAKAPEPIRARTDFAALALFAATRADRRGGPRARAGEAARQPDALPRDGRRRGRRAPVRHGRGDDHRAPAADGAAVAAALPQLRRPFELPVVVQNQTDARDDGGRRGARAQRLAHRGRRPPGSSVPANDRVEVRFPMAAVLAGTARFQVGAASGDAADAAEVELPVWTPATTEAFATYGQIDEGAVVQPVRAPAGVVPAVRRPRGHDVVDRAPGADRRRALPRRVPVRVRRAALLARPRGRGAARRARGVRRRGPADARGARGRGEARPRAAAGACRTTTAASRFWRRGDESWPYVSIHVAHALARAKAKGFDVPAPMLDAVARGTCARSTAHIPSRLPAGRQAHAPRVRALRPRAPRRRATRPRRGRSCARPASTSSRSRRSASCSPCSRGTPPRRPRSPRSVGASRTASPRRRAPRTSRSPTGTAPTCCCTPTGAPTRSCSRRSSVDQPQSDLDPEARRGPARAPHGRPLDEHAGERVRAARPRPLLPDLREGDARLRGARLARRPLRRRARVPGPHDRTAPHRDPDERRSATAGRHVRPRPGEGRARPALLPHRHALRAAEPRARPARPRLHGRARVRGASTTRRTSGATATARGTSGPGRACA